MAEEVTGKGSAVFDFTKVLSEEAYVLDLEGRVGTAAYTAPSKLVLHGQESAENPLTRALPRARVSRHSGRGRRRQPCCRMGNVDEETTVNDGTIKGGIATNIVPDSCTVKGEVRSLEHEKALRQAETGEKAVRALPLLPPERPSISSRSSPPRKPTGRPRSIRLPRALKTPAAGWACPSCSRRRWAQRQQRDGSKRPRGASSWQAP